MSDILTSYNGSYLDVGDSHCMTSLPLCDVRVSTEVIGSCHLYYPEYPTAFEPISSKLQQATTRYTELSYGTNQLVSIHCCSHGSITPLLFEFASRYLRCT